MAEKLQLHAASFVFGRIFALFGLLLVLANIVQANAQDLVGTPLNANRNFVLGNDLGFGHRFSPSLGENYQDWGAQTVTKTDGFPARLGEQSIRFETRQGFCGWDGGWSDCNNGRNRHELSTSRDQDPSDTDLWFALSFYLPEGYDVPARIGNSIFQLWSGGRDSFQFKFKTGAGFIAQRKLDEVETVLLQESDVHGRWIDVLMQVRNSMSDRGLLQIWVDGEHVYDYYGRTIAGTDSGAPNYFKFGIYNTAFDANGAPIGPNGNSDGEGLPDLHLFFDEVRFAPNCAGLALSDLGYDCNDFTYDGADHEQVRHLQSALNTLGCDVGAVDGVVGRRTVQQALDCRRFPPGELPDTVSVSSIPGLAALYAQAVEQGMPEVPRVNINDALSEIVGGNDDNALSIKARADDLELDFILIGHFRNDGGTDWLSILFKDNLSDAEADAALQCRDVNVQNWGDESRHAEIRFMRNSAASWDIRAADCLASNLPADTNEELAYLLDNLRAVAEEIAADGYSGTAHKGLSRFIDMVSTGEVSVAGR